VDDDLRTGKKGKKKKKNLLACGPRDISIHGHEKGRKKKKVDPDALTMPYPSWAEAIGRGKRGEGGEKKKKKI